MSYKIPAEIGRLLGFLVNFSIKTCINTMFPYCCRYRLVYYHQFIVPIAKRPISTIFS